MGGHVRPEHWFAGRKRYFDKHFGEGKSVLADVAFAASLATAKLRGKVCGRDTSAPHLVGDVLCYGLRHLLDR